MLELEQSLQSLYLSLLESPYLIKHRAYSARSNRLKLGAKVVLTSAGEQPLSALALGFHKYLASLFSVFLQPFFSILPSTYLLQPSTDTPSGYIHLLDVLLCIEQRHSTLIQ